MPCLEVRATCHLSIVAASMRRFYMTVATLGVLAAVAAPQAASAQMDDQDRIATVHIWTDSGEQTYDVDLRRRMITKQWSAPTGSGKEAGWVKTDIDAHARQSPAYERLTGQVKARSDSNVDPGLTEWLQSIEGMKGAGYVPADFLVTSPDGGQVVLRSFMKPLLLVDLSTLKVNRLLDKVGDEMPRAAWSTDSGLLAFARVDSGELRVFDVKRQSSAVITRSAPPWITELSWSPTGAQVVALGLVNRRMDKNPLALLAAASGHPIFRNDAVLFVCGADGGGAFSVPLQNGIAEPASPHFRIDWK